MSKLNLFELNYTDEFLKLIEDDKQIIVLDFHASWCGPCVKLGKFLEELVLKEKKYPDVVFAKVDIDKKIKVKYQSGSEEDVLAFEDLIDKFKVEGIPRVLVFKGAELLKDISGYKPAVLLETLDNLSR